MKALLGLLASIGLATSGVSTLTSLTTTTQINISNYSSILVDVTQDISVGASNSGGAHDKSTENIRFSDIQTELHMDYDAFIKADFNIRAIGLFKISTHLNPNVWSDAEFRKEESSSNQIRYVIKLHHEAQNGWAKQKGDIKIILTIDKDNSMWIKTTVSAESYGSVSSTLTSSELKGISFK